MEPYSADDHGHYGRSSAIDNSRPFYDDHQRLTDQSRSVNDANARQHRRTDRPSLDYDDALDYTYSTQSRHHSPPSEVLRQYYQDRDDEHYRSPPRGRYSRSDSRSRSRSRNWSRSPRRGGRGRSPRHDPPANRDIIMEGLPTTMDEKDVKSELEQYYEIRGLKDVRVIRDRKTGHSRGFGFLQFKDIQAASSFLEQYYPEIKLQGKDTRPRSIGIAYSRQREDRDPVVDEDWLCGNCTASNYARRIECFKCQASKALYNAGPPQILQIRNTGDSDVSPDATPSQFLLFRGLEASVTEDLLAKGAAKLYKISDEPTSQANQKTKIVSTTATSNFGAQDGSVRRVFVVRDRLSEETWKYGFVEYHSAEDAQAAYGKFNAMDKFTIASKPVMISYIHAGVFIPAGRQDNPKFSFSASNNTSLRLAYWDQKAYLNEHVVSEVPPSASHPFASETANTSDALLAEGLVKDRTKKRKVEASAAGANKKSVPSHLQFWKDRHVELHSSPQSKGDKVTITKSQKDKRTAGAGEASTSNSLPTQSFADPVKNCCYLCSRQFKTSAEVNKHERLSQLHQDNLAKDELKQKAIQKLIKAGVKVQSSDKPGSATSDAQSGQEYRDRAKERRAVHGQPKKLNNNNTPASSSRKSQADGDEDDGDAGEKTASKGASLLGKMGWTAGQGLGAQGTGTVAPIAQDVYAEGVGLGAAGGKLGDAVEEAERRTKGDYGSFLAKTKDMARDRWEAMSKDT